MPLAASLEACFAYVFYCVGFKGAHFSKTGQRMTSRPIRLERTMRFAGDEAAAREHDSGFPEPRTEAFPPCTACGFLRKRDFTVITSTCRGTVLVVKIYGSQRCCCERMHRMFFANRS